MWNNFLIEGGVDLLATTSIQEFAARLASREPAPGGGSAAAVSGLLGVSLLEMVLNLTVGRSDFVDQAGFLAQKQKELIVLHMKVQEMIDADANAFKELIAAFALPKTTAQEKETRSQAIQAATQKASEVPLEVAGLCLQTLQIAGTLVGKINPHAASDLLVAALSSHAAVRGALLNTAINLPGLKNPAIAASMEKQLRDIIAAADAQAETIYKAMYAEPPFTVMKGC